MTIAPLFTDHGVLQCHRPISVWGTAPPGQGVRISFKEQLHESQAGLDGTWLVRLDPLPPCALGSEMTIEGDDIIILRDVVIGEVWLCSGQSNMAWTLDRITNTAGEIAAADYPLLRQFIVPRTTALGWTPDDSQGRWQPCSPATASRFTAVGYFAARELQQVLDVPIGLINASLGGTFIESWLSADSLDSAEFRQVHERWQETLRDLPANAAAFEKKVAARGYAQASAQRDGTLAHGEFCKAHPPLVKPVEIRPTSAPSILYRAMIEPLSPYAIRGCFWYQGESNVPRAGEYQALFSILVTSWRAHFEQERLPFIWVQLPGYAADPSESWAHLREAQSRVLALSDTGQAVAIDLGEPQDIHPKNKQPVGYRLALVAKTLVYGLPGEWSGPVFAGFSREDGALRVRFTHADGGLVTRDHPVRSLELAGPDRTFHVAEGKVERASLIVKSSEVPVPIAVRYAWRNYPEADIYNAANLPAAPFRSDDW